MGWFDSMGNMFGSLGGPQYAADPVMGQQTDPYGGYYNKRDAMIYALGNIGQGLGYGLMTRDWKNALAVSNADANGYSEKAMKKNAAAQLMQEADAKKQERAQAAERQKWIEDQISKLPANQQGIARMMPEKFFGAQIDNMFTTTKPADKPAAIQEYEYARQQGFKGTFQDWEASKKGGMALTVDPDTGQVTFQQGANIKPLTEGQSKDATFATRAEGALKVFEPVANSMTSLKDSAASQVPVLGNYAKSGDYQKAEQAGREFLQAILRKDTGAAITPQEVNEYGTVYFPRPGDSADVLSQKAASRQRAVAALKAGMTPQAILASEIALRNGAGGSAVSGPSPNDPLGLR